MLVAGCYERFLFGYKHNADAVDQASSLVRTFNYPAHKGAVKCITTAAGIIASGGADDLIHLYDIEAGRDLGFLMNPGDGAVTAVDFHVPAAGGPPSHLLNGSSDGTISVWQGGSWECLKTMEGHKGEVNAVSVHPSGSAALSVGRDRELRIWNLRKGRITYHSRLAGEAQQVAFAPAGTSYSLVVGRDASLHSAEGSGAQLADMPHPTKVLSSAFFGSHGLLTGCEDGSLRLWDTRCSRAAVQVEGAHGARVRGVTALGAAHPASAATATAARRRAPKAEDTGSSGSDSDGDDEQAEETGADDGGRTGTLAALCGGLAGVQLAASASTDGILRLWDLRSAAENSCLGSPTDCVSGIGAARDRRGVAKISHAD